MLKLVVFTVAAPVHVYRPHWKEATQTLYSWNKDKLWQKIIMLSRDCDMESPVCCTMYMMLQLLDI